MTNSINPEAVDLVRELARTNNGLELSHDVVAHILEHGDHPAPLGPGGGVQPTGPGSHAATEAVRVIKEIASRIEPPKVVVAGRIPPPDAGENQ